MCKEEGERQPAGKDVREGSRGKQRDSGHKRQGQDGVCRAGIRDRARTECVGERV